MSTEEKHPSQDASTTPDHNTWLTEARNQILLSHYSMYRTLCMQYPAECRKGSGQIQLQTCKAGFFSSYSGVMFRSIGQILTPYNDVELQALKMVFTGDLTNRTMDEEFEYLLKTFLNGRPSKEHQLSLYLTTRSFIKGKFCNTRCTCVAVDSVSTLHASSKCPGYSPYLDSEMVAQVRSTRNEQVERVLEWYEERAVGFITRRIEYLEAIEKNRQLAYCEYMYRKANLASDNHDEERRAINAEIAAQVKANNGQAISEAFIEFIKRTKAAEYAKKRADEQAEFARQSRDEWIWQRVQQDMKKLCDELADWGHRMAMQ
jgi:hypothetical protein